MDQQTFIQKQNEYLKDIPPEFHTALKNIAWDEGHLWGPSEVLCTLKDLIDALQQSIVNFENRVRQEGKSL